MTKQYFVKINFKSGNDLSFPVSSEEKANDIVMGIFEKTFGDDKAVHTDMNGNFFAINQDSIEFAQVEFESDIESTK